MGEDASELAYVDEKGRPLEPNCVILRSKKFGGIKYVYCRLNQSLKQFPASNGMAESPDALADK